MRAYLIFAYGVLAYVSFLGVFLYAIGFIGGFLTPTRLDGAHAGGNALLINLGLLALFALQHSGMARPGFKRWLTRFIPKEMERSTYVLATNAALIALFAFWQPLGGTVWHVEHPAARATLWALYGAGWLLVLVSTFAINHFDLFGLRQSWFALRGEPYRPLPFRTPLLYRMVRHPLYIGWFTVFWATPEMGLARFVFAIGCTLYILIAIQLEERDLMDAHPEYAEYRRQVPALLPRLAGSQPKLERVHETV